MPQFKYSPVAIRRIYSDACDNLFIHSSIDTTYEDRQKAEKRYNEAVKLVMQADMLPNECYIHPRERDCKFNPIPCDKCIDFVKCTKINMLHNL